MPLFEKRKGEWNKKSKETNKGNEEGEDGGTEKLFPAEL
jgi:hypothetical protein